MATRRHAPTPTPTLVLQSLSLQPITALRKALNRKRAKKSQDGYHQNCQTEHRRGLILYLIYVEPLSMVQHAPPRSSCSLSPSPTHHLFAKGLQSKEVEEITRRTSSKLPDGTPAGSYSVFVLNEDWCNTIILTWCLPSQQMSSLVLRKMRFAALSMKERTHTTDDMMAVIPTEC